MLAYSLFRCEDVCKAHRGFCHSSLSFNISCVYRPGNRVRNTAGPSSGQAPVAADRVHFVTPLRPAFLSALTMSPCWNCADKVKNRPVTSGKSSRRKCRRCHQDYYIDCVGEFERSQGLPELKVL